MKVTRKPFRSARLAAFALVLLAVGADSESKSYDVSELKFDAPTTWKSVTPRSALSQLQFVVTRVKGDKEDAVMTVSAFPGGGGGTEANIKRWQSQFKDAEGNPAKVDSKTVKGKNVEATRVEVLGHYYPPPFLREMDRPDFFLLGAVIQTKETGYYFKMIGPERTVAGARDAFDKLLASIAAKEGK
jgi:hypothetical protein